MPLNRRSVLKGIGTVGATLTFTGFATASGGRARYVVGANGNAAGEVEAADYDMLNELAGGDVLLVAGPEGKSEEIAGINGVSTALRDFDVELEDPVFEEDAGADAEAAVEDVYDEYLWDKQVQQVREAHKHATGAGRTVAVLDTGVDDTHPDLDVDVEHSAAIIDGQPEPHDGPRGGDHATHVAGTVAGTGTVGMLGTAPDATIVSVRILGPDTGTWGDILAAMEYAADIGADAANMSIGTDPLPPQANAAQYRRLLQSTANQTTNQGTLLVGSAGNSDTRLQQGGIFTLPNSLAGVMSVSAAAPNDRRAFYSNYGTNEIDVGAPGGGYETLEKTLATEGVEWPFPLNLVYSTLPGGRYGWKAGTSMAAPQVSGLAALVCEAAPDTNAKQVQNAIQHGAEGNPGRGDPEFAAGRTNALATLERLQ
jgi:subtilisin family serine protease